MGAGRGERGDGGYCGSSGEESMRHGLFCSEPQRLSAGVCSLALSQDSTRNIVLSFELRMLFICGSWVHII